MTMVAAVTKRCPYCNSSFKGEEILSCSTIGGRLSTDGRISSVPMPDPVEKCSICNRYFLIADAPSDEDYQLEKPVKVNYDFELTGFTIETLHECINDNADAWGRETEIKVRLFLLRKGNEKYHCGATDEIGCLWIFVKISAVMIFCGVIFSNIFYLFACMPLLIIFLTLPTYYRYYRALKIFNNLDKFKLTHEYSNLVRLAEILDKNIPENIILKAEVLRNLGRFDASIELLNFPFATEAEPLVTTIRTLAKEQKRLVAMVK